MSWGSSNYMIRWSSSQSLVLVPFFYWIFSNKELILSIFIWFSNHWKIMKCFRKGKKNFSDIFGIKKGLFMYRARLLLTNILYMFFHLLGLWALDHIILLSLFQLLELHTNYKNLFGSLHIFLSFSAMKKSPCFWNPPMCNILTNGWFTPGICLKLFIIISVFCCCII